MKTSEIKQKLASINLDQYGIKLTQTFITEIIDIVKWIEDGGDGMGEWDNPNAKIRNMLTNDDVGELIAYIDDAAHAPNFKTVVEKAIDLYGSKVSDKMYRGMSEGEYKSIMKSIENHSHNLSMTDARSFTTDYDIAKKFAQYGGGNSQTDFHSTQDHSHVRLMTILAPTTTNLILNYTEFMQAYYVSFYVADIMVEKQELDELLSYNEYEFIVSKRAKFTVIDSDRMIFKI